MRRRPVADAPGSLVVRLREGIEQGRELGKARVSGEALALGGFESCDLGLKVFAVRGGHSKGTVDARGLWAARWCVGDHAPVVHRWHEEEKVRRGYMPEMRARPWYVREDGQREVGQWPSGKDQRRPPT